MKKNNLYIADNEIDLRDLIKKIWKKKTLILSISIIFGLAGYFYTLLKPQEFKAEILLKNPPAQIFEPYNLLRGNYTNTNTNTNTNTTNTNNVIVGQFISDFKLNFLSLDNLQSFIEESREFDNFKRHLKSENISAQDYFANKIGEVKDRNITIANKYFLNYTKELDGPLFLNKYAEFAKKKTIVDFKSVLKLSLLNTINNHQEALEIAKKIDLENPIIKTTSQQQVLLALNEPEALFYKGTKVLSENLIYLKKKLIILENDQFNYNIISQKTIVQKLTSERIVFYSILFGILFSIIIIIFQPILKSKN